MCVDPDWGLGLAVVVALYIYRNNRKLQAALTASQEAREALRLSEERHRFLADNVSDVIWTMDLHGRNTHVSPSVERMRGYTVAEAMQQTIDEALTPASAKIAQAGVARALEAIQAKQKAPDFRAELEQPCKYGGTVWTEVRFSCVYAEAGEFLNFLGVTRDISERKRTELDLQIAAIAFQSQDWRDRDRCTQGHLAREPCLQPDLRLRTPRGHRQDTAHVALRSAHARFLRRLVDID